MGKQGIYCEWEPEKDQGGKKSETGLLTAPSFLLGSHLLKDQ